MSAPDRPDLFLINVAFDTHGVHGHMFFRDPPHTELRRVVVHGTGSTAEYRLEPARGDTRDGWEPFLTEAAWLMALILPDTPEERF
ncbi:hypothetical protein KK092_09700 [Curtobacterium flaccumfaciens pv. flaccumfaciens]|uniref:hypothetical protein n=1 Tax=Curtobacterium flaccumfaciens TaxID=2035 RepID=UPI001BDEFD48|nr:hypothetical protein [Curtobacterium flaccumfaciens]MBT1669655.1 hypothetical protein [Curtobacterium flaccumfaciens pv. flaccumfaciens]